MGRTSRIEAGNKTSARKFKDSRWTDRIGAAGLLAALLIAWFAALPTMAAEPAPNPHLSVDGRWLKAHGTDAKLRIVDLRPKARYKAGHIPGAVHVSPKILHTRIDGIAGLLAPVPDVESALRQAGISADSIVVAYDDNFGLSATRLFWALEYLGHADVRVLDGGWKNWRKQQLGISWTTPQVTAGNFTARRRDERFAGLSWIRPNLDNPGVTLVDARSSGEYEGSKRYANRGGHIPGAVLVDWRNHLDPQRPGMLRPVEELRELYDQRGISPEREIVVYCQIMARAAHTYFVLRWLGYPRVRGYDGSWSEWGNRDDTPIKDGAAPR